MQDRSIDRYGTSFVQLDANPFAIVSYQITRISNRPVFDFSSPSYLDTSPRIDIMKEDHGSIFYILFLRKPLE